MVRVLLLALLLAPLASLGEAPIYRTTDEHGNVAFTDTPPANASDSERVDITHINSTPAPPSAPVPTVVPVIAVNETTASTVTITSPVNETAIPSGPGNFPIEVNVQPPLGGNQALQLMMDGAPTGSPQSDPLWDLTNVLRGQHDFTVDLIDETGEVLATSPAIRVYVQRPSRGF
jgi:hypothetical protein